MYLHTINNIMQFVYKIALVFDHFELERAIRHVYWMDSVF